MPPKDYEKGELYLGIVGDNGEIRESMKLSDVPVIDYSEKPKKNISADMPM